MERDDPRPDSTDAVPAAPPADEVPTDLPIALGDLFQLLATDRTRQLLYFLTARGARCSSKSSRPLSTTRP